MGKKGLTKRFFVAVLLSSLVFPGLGQIYNKEIRKGGLIIFFLLTIVVVFTYHLSVMIFPYLPYDVSQLNLRKWSDIVKDLTQQFPKPFFYYNLLFLVVWTYSVFDAGITAYADLNKKDEKPNDNPDQET